MIHCLFGVQHSPLDLAVLFKHMFEFEPRSTLVAIGRRHHVCRAFAQGHVLTDKLLAAFMLMLETLKRRVVPPLAATRAPASSSGGGTRRI